jgi:hypothetical protein
MKPEEHLWYQVYKDKLTYDSLFDLEPDKKIQVIAYLSIFNRKITDYSDHLISLIDLLNIHILSSTLNTRHQPTDFFVMPSGIYHLFEGILTKLVEGMFNLRHDETWNLQNTGLIEINRNYHSNFINNNWPVSENSPPGSLICGPFNLTTLVVDDIPASYVITLAALGITIDLITINSNDLYRICNVIHNLIQIGAFFQGILFPDFLIPFRGEQCLRSLLKIGYPLLIKSYTIGYMLTDVEQGILYQYINEIYDTGGDFLIDYYNICISNMTSDSFIVRTLNSFMVKSMEKELQLVTEFLKENEVKNIDSFFLNQEVPSNFIDKVRKFGIEAAIQDIHDSNKNRFLAFLKKEFDNPIIVNEMTIAHDSIYEYCFEDLCYFSEKNNVYFFLYDELEHLTTNPYTRNPLPDDINYSFTINPKTLTAKWSVIVKRPLELA